MRLRTVAVLVATFSSSVFAQLPSGKRGITAEDYPPVRARIRSARVARRSQVVYVVSRVDRAQNRRIPSVWIASTDGSRAPRVLLDETWSPSAPRWSPDGASIAFISSHAAGDTGTAGRRGAAPRAQLWVVATIVRHAAARHDGGQ
jgi:dipeptidyl aminopeptidase/acylaminoacyl peptidase